MFGRWFSWDGGRQAAKPAPAAIVRQEPVIDLVALSNVDADTRSASRPASTEHLAPTPRPARTPAISKYAEPVRLREVPAIEQGRRLLRWLQGDNTGADIDSAPADEIVTLLADDVMPAYREMCAELAWAEAAWNQVGRHFREALGDGRKTYAWVVADDGSRHRLRVYRIPALSLAPADSRSGSRPAALEQGRALKRAA